MRATSKAKAEVMLMGCVVSVENEKEAKEITDYILNVVRQGKTENGQDTAYEVFKNGIPSSCEVKHMVVNSIDDMILITYLLDTEDEDYPEDLSTGDGILSYVYNVNVDYFSELGYTFYKKSGNFYKRIA